MFAPSTVIPPISVSVDEFGLRDHSSFEMLSVISVVLIVAVAIFAIVSVVRRQKYPSSLSRMTIDPNPAEVTWKDALRRSASTLVAVAFVTALGIAALGIANDTYRPVAANDAVLFNIGIGLDVGGDISKATLESMIAEVYYEMPATSLDGTVTAHLRDGRELSVSMESPDADHITFTVTNPEQE